MSKDKKEKSKNQNIGALFPSCKVQLLGMSPILLIPQLPVPLPPLPPSLGTSYPLETVQQVSWILGPKQAPILFAPFPDSGGPHFTLEPGIAQWSWSKFWIYWVSPFGGSCASDGLKICFQWIFRWMFCSESGIATELDMVLCTPDASATFNKILCQRNEAEKLEG